MKKVLVLCKETGQSKAFKKDAEKYRVDNALPFEWVFADDKEYVNVLEGVDIVLISPEMILVQAKIKADLDSKGIKYVELKPADFGLRRLDKIVPLIEL
ncbi:hypothetical protein [Clostridium sp. YIM B02551]|uniref:hypothetical protein n=1 Tax=Clostridium sp. YIM B02551 TaxID=2910679 RepID=UPI001EEBFBD3|nr:hypothetical protein [Clostridium sp. YIM B02551]